MKYLFIVQGEGRGHLTQAMTMEKMLVENGHTVVGMLVGKSKGRALPTFFERSVSAPVHHFNSFNFVPNVKNKKPNQVKSVLYNLMIGFKFFPSIRFLKDTIENSGADVIVNFYEMLGTLAHLKCKKKIPMVVVGHQFLFLHKDFHFPPFGYEGHMSLDFYSWAIARGASRILALSFRKMPDDEKHNIKVVPPLLRPAVLAFRGENGNDSPEFKKGNYILGYMLNAGFAEEVLVWHKANPEVPLHFFWDNKSEGQVKKVDDNLSFYYLDDHEFLRQMAGCMAYASTGGFESICEAMYLGKPLMMVPSHIEQQCNAYDATKCNAAVSADRFDLSVLLNFAKNGFEEDVYFPQWARSAEKVFLKELEDVVNEKK